MVYMSRQEVTSVDFAQKSLMGIPVAYGVSWRQLLADSGIFVSERSPMDDLQVPDLGGLAGKVPTDMAMVRFGASRTRREIIAFGWPQRLRPAYPRECIAIARACPYLAVQLEVRSLALLSPRLCWNGGDDPCLFGIRYAGGDSRIIAYPYWYDDDEWPGEYWFLFADKHQQPTKVWERATHMPVVRDAIA